MTAPVARWATDDDHPQLGEYALFCHELGCSDRVLRDRLRYARAFLAEHPDQNGWLARPTPARLADLRRVKAWPLVCWAALSGRLRLDLDLLMAKDLGGMSTAARALWPEDFERLWAKAKELRWSYNWSRNVVDEFVPAVIAWSGRRLTALTADVLADMEGAFGEVVSVTTLTRKHWRSTLFGLRQLLFESGQVSEPPRRRRPGRPIETRLAVVPAVEVRQAMARYARARSGVLSASSVNGLIDDLCPFGEFLGEYFPEVRSLRQLERHHVEAFLAWNRTRNWRGRVARDRRVSVSVAHSAVLTLRNFLDDITLWGWAERPRRRLVFASDVPRLPRPLPRALAPDVDQALMGAVVNLDDPFARSAIILLRTAGLRLGECLDLELSCVVDHGRTGSWLRVPLGKLGTERAVPLSGEALAALDAWAAQRGVQRPHPHPRTGRPTDFLFAEHGQRLRAWRVRKGLRRAALEAGLSGPGGEVLNPTPHQLRHTYATELANAGMSLQALMAVLGHVTPEMTLRYATLASPTLRSAYDDAIGKVRRLVPVAPPGRPVAPSKLDWLASEFLKTRLASGYCARHLAAGACPYANICETCDSFTPGLEHLPVLEDQLADLRSLGQDAERRSWPSEVERHRRVAGALEGHIRRLRASAPDGLS